ncbi:MAG TPA: hypothetical protein VHI52_01595, partial [Verrucomicrobiae bacterium]|nr:hypothetical protein [Verrucomicrobiae bacterium]
MGTLRRALWDTFEARWRGIRTERRTLSQSLALVEYLESEGVTETAAVTESHLKGAIIKWKNEGLSPATIQCRLVLGSTMGIAARTKFRVPKVRKWWLRPEDEEEVVAYLAGHHSQYAGTLSDLVQWTTRTGLRIEESLRVTRAMFVDLFGDRPSLSVPGTKSDLAGNVVQAISADAAAVARQRLGKGGRSGDLLFP